MQTTIYAAAAFCCIMSTLLLAAMGIDKYFARIGARRIPEKRLFLMAVLGGAAGGLLGMYAFRHKTRHITFVAGFWTLAALQMGALGYLAYHYIV